MAVVSQTWFSFLLAAFAGHRVRWDSPKHFYLSDAESEGSDRRIMAPLLKSADSTAPSYAFVQLWRPHCKPFKQLLVEECRLLQLRRVAALSVVSLNLRSRVPATDKRRSIPSQEVPAFSIIFQLLGILS